MPDPNTPTPPRTERLTAAELDALERLEREATPGPWKVVGNTLYFCTREHRHLEGSCWYAFPGNAELARFIDALRNAAPRLLSSARALEAVEAELLHLRGVLATLNGDGGQRAEKVGTEQAVREGLERYAALVREADAARHERDRLRAEVEAMRGRAEKAEVLLRECRTWSHIANRASCCARIDKFLDAERAAGGGA